jgi:hypothetical protein
MKMGYLLLRVKRSLHLKILERHWICLNMELSVNKQLRFIQLLSGHPGDRGFFIRFSLGFILVVVLNLDHFGQYHPWITFLLPTSALESEIPGCSP